MTRYRDVYPYDHSRVPLVEVVPHLKLFHLLEYGLLFDIFLHASSFRWSTRTISMRHFSQSMPSTGLTYSPRDPSRWPIHLRSINLISLDPTFFPGHDWPLLEHGVATKKSSSDHAQQVSNCCKWYLSSVTWSDRILTQNSTQWVGVPEVFTQGDRERDPEVPPVLAGFSGWNGHMRSCRASHHQCQLCAGGSLQRQHPQVSSGWSRSYPKVVF